MQKATSFWVVEDDVKFVFVCLLIFTLFVVCKLWPTFAFIFDVVAFVMDTCFMVWLFLHKCFNELQTRSWARDEDKRNIVKDNAKLQQVENVLNK